MFLSWIPSSFSLVLSHRTMAYSLHTSLREDFFVFDFTILWDVTDMDERMDTIMYGTKEVCDMVGVSARQLEYWVLIGVVHPIMEPHGSKVFKKFTAKDVRILKEVKSLTDEGVLVSRAAQKVRMKIGGWASLGRGNHD